MIITKLQGGLGNQMFQYAAARSISYDKKVYLDFSFLQKNTSSSAVFTGRDFEIGIFNIAYKTFSEDLRKIFFGKTFISRFFRRFILGTLTHVKQTENEFVKISHAENIYLDGYFQSEKYFQNIREILLKDFTFPSVDARNNIILQRIHSSENSVSIHIRRGDYLKAEVKKYHGTLSPEYYYEAIRILEDKFENCKYFIFSDDISYSKEIFRHIDNIEYIDINHGKDSWKDMFLMSNCTHHIIANSSFSWWGAWLCKKDGKTIAPNNWLNKEVANFDIHDFIPSYWTII